jgi:hypothetical protein
MLHSTGHYHYQQADNRLVQLLSERILALLTVSHTFKRWIRLHNPDRPWDSTINYHNSAKGYPSPTYYAAGLGFDSVLAGILSRSPADVNAQGEGEYSNALQAVSFSGHEKVVQVLFEGGAEVNAQAGKLISDLDTMFEEADLGFYCQTEEGERKGNCSTACSPNCLEGKGNSIYFEYTSCCGG